MGHFDNLTVSQCHRTHASISQVHFSMSQAYHIYRPKAYLLGIQDNLMHNRHNQIRQSHTMSSSDTSFSGDAHIQTLCHQNAWGHSQWVWRRNHSRSCNMHSCSISGHIKKSLGAFTWSGKWVSRSGSIGDPGMPYPLVWTPEQYKGGFTKFWHIHWQKYWKASVVPRVMISLLRSQSSQRPVLSYMSPFRHYGPASWVENITLSLSCLHLFSNPCTVLWPCHSSVVKPHSDHSNQHP